MPVVGDALDAFYLGAFVFGLLFSAASHLVGALHLGGVGHDASPAHPPSGPHGTHGAGQAVHLGPLNPPSVLAFVTWFGGIGYQARHALGLVPPGSLLCGAAGGLIGGGLVWLFLARVVLPGERTLDPDDFRMDGKVARVSSGIRPGGTGEIVYEQAGARGVSAARLADDGALPRGAEVVVLGVERGIALVRPVGAAGPP